jgi:hypothetical protein
MVDMNYNNGTLASTVGVQLNSATAVEYGSTINFGTGNQVETDNDYYEFTPTGPLETPTPTSPINGATGQSTTPTLQASAFTGGSGVHQDSQFQVCSNSTCTGGSDPLRDYTAGSATTSWVVSPALTGGTTYFWRVRYQDDANDWSGWSAMTGTPRGEFTTLSASYGVTFSGTNAGNPGTQNGETDNTTTGWTNILNNGTTNVWSSNQTLPFSFDFYGSPVTQYKISCNGLLTFDTAASGPPSGDNVVLPSATAPDKSIAFFWDTYGATSGNDEASVKTFGTSPDRQLWIRWLSLSLGASSYSYFALVLEETTNNIYAVRYNYFSGSVASTAGVQLDSSTGVTYNDSITINWTGTSDVAESNNDYYTFTPTP